MSYATLGATVYPLTAALTSNTNFFRKSIDPPPTTQTVEYSRNPEEWGPHLWYYLHTVANNYPENPTKLQCQKMKEWLTALEFTIPCGDCSKHFSNYIKGVSSHLDDICSSKHALTRLFVDIHNKVNERKGRRTYSVEDAVRKYPKV